MLSHQNSRSPIVAAKETLLNRQCFLTGNFKAALLHFAQDAKEKEGNLQASLERLEAELQTNAQRAQACAGKRAKLESARAASASRLAQAEHEACSAAGRIRELERAQPAGPRNTRDVMQEFRQRRPWAAAAQQAVEVRVLPYDDALVCCGFLMGAFPHGSNVRVNTSYLPSSASTRCLLSDCRRRSETHSWKRTLSMLLSF